MAFLAALIALAGCAKDDGPTVDQSALDAELRAAMTHAAGGQGLDFFRLPDSDDLSAIPQDPLNPLTAEKVELGRLLFHETGFGLEAKMNNGIGTYSCASCHHAPGGFQACLKQGIGDGGEGFGMTGEGRLPSSSYPIDSLDIQPIRTPTAMNVAYQELMLWNGQFGATGANSNTQSQWTAGSPKETNFLGYEGVEIQAIAGLKVHRMVIDQALVSSLGYQDMFDQVFPGFSPADRYTRETAGLAIAAYERTILANRSPFQMWLKGESEAMTAAQKRGAILFFSEGSCSSCHTGPALSSMDFMALGMPDLEGPGIYGTETDGAENAKLGRGGFTGNAQDNYKFKVPQLYNLMNSPFYGHGGSFTSVKEVINYKNEAEAENPDVPESQLDPRFQPLGLSPAEVDLITDFIENSLKDPDLYRYVPSDLPSGNCFPNADDMSKTELGCQ